MLSNLELALHPMASPVLSVLVKSFIYGLNSGILLWSQLVDMSCLVRQWRIRSSLGNSVNHPIEYFCQFLPVCCSSYHPHHHAAFWGQSCHGVSMSLSWGPAWGVVSSSGSVIVRPLLHQARVNKSFSFLVCLYAPVWWWQTSHNHLLPSQTGLDMPASVLG